MALLDPITRIPTLGRTHYVPKSSTPSERVHYSETFANNLKVAAPHINVMDLEHGKQMVQDVANFSLEKSPAFLLRVKMNLEGINTKLDLQKYVYNSILRGEHLYIR